MNTKKNILTSLIFQLATIIQGLILPRLIIGTFGSSVNGMLSSITQFLSFISLLEGGLGAVVLAELYLPIQKKDNNHIKQILCACQSFFSKLAISFLIYTIILSILYPLLWSKKYSFYYVFTLVWILSITTLVQYLFSITYKLYLQANQKIYIVNIISTITIIINTVLTIVVICIYPKVHLIKLISGIVFLLQPLFIKRFIEPEYKINKRFSIKNKTILTNRWSGFAQNLAHFINMNTDIALITFALGLEQVSVYTVYMLAINALRTIIVSIGNSYQSALGKYYAEGNIKNLSEKFEEFEKYFWLIGITLFETCLILINAFVKIYVKGVADVDYIQPLFAFVMVSANMLYVIREPYRLLVLATGKFKETNKGSIIEAILNIIISLLLVKVIGLVGVAIGTFIAITYRFIYFIIYIHNDIIKRSYKEYKPYFLTLITIMFINGFLYQKINKLTIGFFAFIGSGILTLAFEIILYVFIFKIYNALFKKNKQ